MENLTSYSINIISCTTPDGKKVCLQVIIDDYPSMAVVMQNGILTHGVNIVRRATPNTTKGFRCRASHFAPHIAVIVQNNTILAYGEDIGR